jgi:hypothetical protein
MGKSHEGQCVLCYGEEVFTVTAWSGCKMGVFSKSVTLKIYRSW